MKWAWISIGAALIVAITVITCFSIYTNNDKCYSIVWWLYGLLIVCILACISFRIVKLNDKAVRKNISQRQKEEESKYTSFVTAVIKDILVLQTESKTLLEDMKKIKESKKE